jgi:hypothetical protein
MNTIYPIELKEKISNTERIIDLQKKLYESGRANKNDFYNVIDR